MSFKILPDSQPQESPKTGIQNISVTPEGALRTAARLGAEGVSRVAGLGGDVFNLLNEFVAGPISEKITGEKALPYEDTYLGKILKTSGDLRERLNKDSSDYLAPQNDIEKFGDEVVGDAISLVLPVGKFRPSAKASAFTSLGANLLGDTVKQYTGDDKKGAYTKAGAMFVLSLLNKPSAATYAKELYDAAENALPPGATQNASRQANNLNGLRNKILQGRSIRDLADSEKAVVEEVNKVLRNINHGEMDIRTAKAAKRSVNENLTKLKFETPDKAARQRASKLITNVNHELESILEDYGQTNPTFIKNQKAADEAFGAIAQSNFISRGVEKISSYSPKTVGLISMFDGKAGQVASKAALPYQSIKLMYRIHKSPELAKYYGNALKAAAEQNAQVFNAELEKLDKGLEAEEKNKRFKLID